MLVTSEANKTTHKHLTIITHTHYNHSIYARLWLT